MTKDCGLCNALIKTKTSYRKVKNLPGDTKEFLKNCVYNNIQYLCSRYFYRITRVDKTKIDLENELSHFIKKTDTPSKQETPEIHARAKTPSKARLLCKRRLLSAPTPKKLKKLKPDSCRTAVKQVNYVVIEKTKTVTPKKPESSKRGRSLSFTSDSNVQISIKTSNGQVKNIARVTNRSLQTVCTAIAGKRSVQQICKTIFKEGELRNILQGLFIDSLAVECKNIVKKRSKSDIQSKQPVDLLNINLDELQDSWKVNGSLLVPTLAAVAGKTDSQKLTPDVVFSGASLLRSRNQGYSLLHHAVGLILDHGGATDETIEIGQKLGICVAPNTVYAKKRELASFHSDELEKSMQVPVKKIETAFTQEKCTSGGVVWSSKTLEYTIGQNIFNPVLSSQPPIALQQPYQCLTTIDVTSTTVKPTTHGNTSGRICSYATSSTGPTVVGASSRPLTGIYKTDGTFVL